MSAPLPPSGGDDGPRQLPTSEQIAARNAYVMREVLGSLKEHYDYDETLLNCYAVQTIFTNAWAGNRYVIPCPA